MDACLDLSLTNAPNFMRIPYEDSQYSCEYEKNNNSTYEFLQIIAIFYAFANYSSIKTVIKITKITIRNTKDVTKNMKTKFLDKCNQFSK